MKGVSHLTIGAATGIGIGLYKQVDPLTVGVFAVIGGICGLVPDLDTNGLAANKITLSKQVIKTPMWVLGMFVILYALYQAITMTNFNEQFLYRIITGGGLLLLSTIITQKRMLTLTGIGFVVSGVALDMTLWLILLGVYIVIASFLPHRSYTHSIIGAVFFGVILYMAEGALNINGVFLVGLSGYVSHLIADMKLLPVNKRGVKLFAPLWNKEF